MDVRVLFWRSSRDTCALAAICAFLIVVVVGSTSSMDSSTSSCVSIREYRRPSSLLEFYRWRDYRFITLPMTMGYQFIEIFAWTSTQNASFWGGDIGRGTFWGCPFEAQTLPRQKGLRRWFLPWSKLSWVDLPASWDHSLVLFSFHCGWDLWGSGFFWDNFQRFESS